MASILIGGHSLIKLGRYMWLLPRVGYHSLLMEQMSPVHWNRRWWEIKEMISVFNCVYSQANNIISAWWEKRCSVETVTYIGCIHYREGVAV